MIVQSFPGLDCESRLHSRHFIYFISFTLFYVPQKYDCTRRVNVVNGLLTLKYITGVTAPDRVAILIKISPHSCARDRGHLIIPSRDARTWYWFFNRASPVRKYFLL